MSNIAVSGLALMATSSASLVYDTCITNMIKFDVPIY